MPPWRRAAISVGENIGGEKRTGLKNIKREKEKRSQTCFKKSCPVSPEGEPKSSTGRFFYSLKAPVEGDVHDYRLEKSL